MVCSVVPVGHFLRIGSARQGQQLVAEANPEYRHIVLQNFADCMNRIVTRFGVSRAIR